MGSWGKKIQHWLGIEDMGRHESVPPPESSVSSASQESSTADSPPAVSEELVAEVAMPEPDDSVLIDDDVVESDEGNNGTMDPAEDTAPAMEEIGDRRFDQRIEHCGWARFSAEGIAGEGLVTNLSIGGALVERATESLAAGTKFTLRLKPAGGFETVDLEAEVVREMEGGFAFRFTRVDVEAYSVLREVISRGPSKA